jgi:hypothetical protein
MATDTELASVVEAEVGRAAKAIGEALQAVGRLHGKVEVGLTVIFDPDDVMVVWSEGEF